MPLTYGHQFDVYGHKLVDTGDRDLERRINWLAEKLNWLMITEGMTDWAMAKRAELFALCLSFFRVIGQGMENEGRTYDDVLIDLLADQLDYDDEGHPRFDPNESPFVSWIRYKYPLSVIDAGNKENKQSPHEGLEKPAGDNDSEGGGSVAEDYNPLLATHATFLDEYAAEAMYVELLTLGTRLKDLLSEDKGTVANTGRHMAFTESVTLLVKSADQDDFGYLENHERDTFNTIEIDFLDMYMLMICRTFLAVWETSVRPKYKSRTSNHLLNTKAYIDYLRRTYDKVVTSAAVSQYRDGYLAMVEKLPLFKGERARKRR